MYDRELHLNYIHVVVKWAAVSYFSECYTSVYHPRSLPNPTGH